MTYQKPQQSAPQRFIESLTNLTYATLFLLWIAVILLASLCFVILANTAPMHAPVALVGKPLWIQIVDAIYYSIITGTSVGYGDIVPRGISKVIASVQSISALFVFALFVTKLVSHRQELALDEVHKLTYEDVFHNTREGLYLARKDIDHVLVKLGEGLPLNDEDWENLSVALKQVQSLLLEIPDFYNADRRLYTIDARREQLLAEAVHRTLHRINALLDGFVRSKIDWEAQKTFSRELQGLVAIVDTTTPLWRDRSPHDGGESFEDILRVKQSIAVRIGAAI